MKIRRQRGFTLIETVLSLLLLSIIALYGFKTQVEDLKDLTAINTAKQLEGMTSVTREMIVRYYKEFLTMEAGKPLVIVNAALKPNPTDMTIFDPSMPTGSEIWSVMTKVSGSANNARSKPIWGAGTGYLVSIKKLPDDACKADCDFAISVCTERPFMADSAGRHVDWARAGKAVSQIGDSAGVVSMTRALVLKMYGGNTIAVPHGSLAKEGQICNVTSYNGSTWGPYFRIDGTKEMKADANIGGFNLVNVDTLSTKSHVIDSACTTPGAISFGLDVAGSEVTLICRQGKWKNQKGNTANPGDSCTVDGTTAESIATGENLVCKNNRYVKFVNLIARNIEVARLAVVDGQTVTKPTCDIGGVPDYTAIVNRVAIDVTQIPPYQSQYFTTTDNGGSWTVSLKLRSDTGTEASGNDYSLAAIMHLECKY